MYERNMTEPSKGALLELSMALNSYKNDFVLVGGWAPFFLSEGYFDHCGSIDIDFVLRPSIIQKYQSIKEIVESLGYTVTRNPFRFEREIMKLDGDGTFDIHLDLLTEPDTALDEEFLVEVQEDLRACLIPGISVVFDHYYVYKLEAVLPGGGEASHPVNIADIVGLLTTKGNALPRLKDKDSYDIYCVAGHYGGSPFQAAYHFNQLIGGDVNKPVVQSALRNIKYAFGSPSRYGCVSVARFMTAGEDIRNDAYQRISAFFNNLTMAI